MLDDFSEHESVMKLEIKREQEKKYINGVLSKLKSKNNDTKIKEELDKLCNSIDSMILKLKFQNSVKKYNKLNEKSKLELMDDIVTNIITSNILLNIEEKIPENLYNHAKTIMSDCNRKEEIRYYKNHNNEMYSELLKDKFADILTRVNKLDKENKNKIIKSMKKVKK